MQFLDEWHSFLIFLACLKHINIFSCLRFWAYIGSQSMWHWKFIQKEWTIYDLFYSLKSIVAFQSAVFPFKFNFFVNYYHFCIIFAILHEIAWKSHFLRAKKYFFKFLSLSIIIAHLCIFRFHNRRMIDIEW